MNLLRKPAALTVTALALAALPATAAQAHDGAHPFKNCTEAYDAGYANIEKGDEHYADRLDRDQDGIGCDRPPADFVPAADKGGDQEEAGAGTEESGGGKDTGTGGSGAEKPAGAQGTDLAETGGDGSTPYIAAAGAVVVLAGGGVLLATRRRRNTDA